MSCACDGSCLGCSTDLAVLLHGYSGNEGMGGMAGIEDASWPTTGDLDTATASLALSVQELGSDVFNDSGDVGSADRDAWLRAWNAFVADFVQWKDGGWFWNPSRRDALIEYRGRYNALLERYHDLAGAIQNGAQAVTGDRPTPGVIAQAESLLTKAVGAALVLGGLYLGWQIAGPIIMAKSRRYAHNPRSPRRRRRRR